MILKTYILLAALGLSLLPRSATAQGNLVTNGGFDTDASGWTITGSSSFNPNNGDPAPDLSLGGTPGMASQTINGLVIGNDYIVSGDYQVIQGVKSAPVDSFGVALNGVFFFETADLENYNWQNFNFVYTASVSSAVLSLSSGLNGTGIPYDIDNISLVAVPEPHSLYLIGAGGMMGAMFLRNRRG